MRVEKLQCRLQEVEVVVEVAARVASASQPLKNQAEVGEKGKAEGEEDETAAAADADMVGDEDGETRKSVSLDGKVAAASAKRNASLAVILGVRMAMPCLLEKQLLKALSLL